jgi:hypothetical protein
VHGMKTDTLVVRNKRAQYGLLLLISSLGNIQFLLSNSLLPIHCRCRRLLLHVNTQGDAQILQDPSGRVIGPSQRPLPNNTHKTLKSDKHQRLRWNSNPQSQQARGSKQTRGHWDRIVEKYCVHGTELL